ncbi:MAG: DNA-processing protein DprA [Gammaproteobacteria bacterium]|nr:DNA-processing protein DprA [Gammaproteobacteria bacterium]
MDQLPDRLALHRSNLPPDTLYKLLDQFGSAAAVLNASASQLEQHLLTPAAIERIQQPDSTGVKRDLAWAEHQDHCIISLDDPRYPEQLKNLSQPPYLLYAIGDTEYLQRPQLAMVGSRNPTAAGRKNAEEFAHHLSNSGITITSGLALGIDGACHLGALEGLAGTVAVVANGLDSIYPTQHTQLARRIAQQGCLITETPVGIAPHKGLFPKRNRIISGLSIGTLVVEAAKNSGSLITARLAMEQGRELFAIPGSIHNPLSRGCHSLIRQGAKLVETTEDILEELIPLVKLASSRHTSDHIEPPAAENKLDSSYQRLLELMDFEPIAIDELITRSNMSAAEIASMLLILELQNHVVAENGRYCRVQRLVWG